MTRPPAGEDVIQHPKVDIRRLGQQSRIMSIELPVSSDNFSTVC